jgi:hypothetical protein
MLEQTTCKLPAGQNSTLYGRPDYRHVLARKYLYLCQDSFRRSTDVGQQSTFVLTTVWHTSA